MIDGGEADDKIIAVLEKDEVFGNWKDISNIPPNIINPAETPFTYKQLPGEEPKCRNNRHLRTRRGAGGDTPQPERLLLKLTATGRSPVPDALRSIELQQPSTKILFRIGINSPL